MSLAGVSGGTTWGAASSPCCCEARVVLPGLLLWSTLFPSVLEQLLVQTVLGYPSVMEAFGRISSSTCPSPRYSHLEIWTLPSPLYLSVLRCLGVASGARFLGRVLGSTVDTCSTRGFWRTSHIFYVWCTQIVAFLSIPQNGEVCTVDASSCSVSSRGSHFESGHYFYELFM